MKISCLEYPLEDKLGTASHVSDDFLKDEFGQYQNFITQNSFMDLQKTVYLELWTFDTRKFILRDYIHWELGRPNAYNLVCSPRFRKLLETVKLPEHRFYNAEVRARKKVYKYYVLHLRNEWQNEIDYQHSCFNIVNFMEDEQIVKQLSEGEVKNVDNYTQMNKILVVNNQYLYPQKLTFRSDVYFDIWGLHGQIAVSQKAKELITNENITGIAFPPFNKLRGFDNLEVIMHPTNHE